MVRRSLVLSFVLIAAMAIPMSASQFIELPFDQVARESTLVVRGTVGAVSSAWNDDHDVIFSYAPIQVKQYIAGEGPSVLMLREVGGTAEGYTQVAVGFPTLREGQEVVLFLSQWEDSADWRIHAYNQGKYVVREVRTKLFATPDPVTQGHERINGGVPRVQTDAVASEASGLSLDELTQMVTAARQPNREEVVRNRE